ncbi:universal stress protein [Yoonia sp.]|jgi:nucleotide-binding universal stress UspA family protein|uniref:universal stress protein n=1 Tax=Yoonia sp. TaxID=2212373 RepID=UPI0025E229C6|nr:universal stress protein [Yoonia sp.]
MYKNILVPMALDHGIGQSALAVARALLSEGGAITALHVYEAPQGSVSAYLDEGVVQDAFDRAQSQLEARAKDEPALSAKIVKGHSGRSIIDVAIAMQADCIVIGSHKPGLIDYLLGSTASRVVRHAPCAVHVLREPN